MTRFLAGIAVAFALAFPAGAENCANVESGFGVNQKPQNTAREIVGQSLDEIIERGWIRFAVYEDFPPFVFHKDGKLTGIDIDIGKLIAREIGVEARFYETAAGENVDADLRNNVWKGSVLGGPVSNVMLHVPYDRELGCRNEQVVLSSPYFNESIAIAFRKSEYPDGGPVPAYFRFDEVGVENDSLADFYLSSVGNGMLIPKMKRYASVAAAMEGLRAGEVKAVMGPRTQLDFGLNNSIDVHEPPLVGLAKGKWTLGVAVRSSWRPLGYTVEDVIRTAVENGSMEKIFAEYGVSYKPPDW